MTCWGINSFLRGGRLSNRHKIPPVDQASNLFRKQLGYRCNNYLPLHIWVHLAWQIGAPAPPTHPSKCLLSSFWSFEGDSQILTAVLTQSGQNWSDRCWLWETSLPRFWTDALAPKTIKRKGLGWAVLFQTFLLPKGEIRKKPELLCGGRKQRESAERILSLIKMLRLA